MTSKRAASNYLTHENWDDEDEPEEAGAFKQADESELKGRVIKKAKRRAVVTEETADKPALFTGFKGFGIPTTQNTTFSFNKKEGNSEASGFKITAFGSSNGDTKATASSVPDKPNNTADDKPSDNTDQKIDINKSKFLAALKSLNESILKWLNSHTSQNPYCYFTPVFSDYAKHLAALKKRYNFDEDTPNVSFSEETQETNEVPTTVSEEREEQNVESESSAATSESAPLAATPTTTASAPAPAASVVSPSPLFSFGTTEKVKPKAKEESEEKPAAVPLFSFGSKSSTSGTTEVSPKPFSFASKSAGSEGSNADPGSGLNAVTNTKGSESEKSVPTTTPMFSFGKQPMSTPSAPSGSMFGPSSSTSGTFSFGLSKTSSTTASAAPTFSFSKGSSFGSSATGSAVSGFSFKSDVAHAKSADSQSAPAASNEDEEYVPPKPEVEKKITEDDALYTKRVKLFYNKNGEYINKGVGNLFVKPLESGKNGLLIRADTNLGTILLNISLSESIPIQRQGKNNVSLVCVPNPPMEVTKGAQDPPPPTMLLIRVKETADADELCDKLNEYKKAS